MIRERLQADKQASGTPTASPVPKVPEWHDDAIHVSNIIRPTHFDEQTILRRTRLLRNVKATPHSVESWRVFLTLLNEERQLACATDADASSNLEMHAAIIRLYTVATSVIPRSAANRYSPAYLEIWLELAGIHDELPDDEYLARDVFKQLKANRIGTTLPRYWNAYADFELKYGDAEKAEKLRGEIARRCPLTQNQHEGNIQASASSNHSGLSGSASLSRRPLPSSVTRRRGAFSSAPEKENSIPTNSGTDSNSGMKARPVRQVSQPQPRQQTHSHRSYTESPEAMRRDNKPPCVIPETPNLLSPGITPPKSHAVQRSQQPVRSSAKRDEPAAPTATPSDRPPYQQRINSTNGVRALTSANRVASRPREFISGTPSNPADVDVKRRNQGVTPASIGRNTPSTNALPPDSRFVSRSTTRLGHSQPRTQSARGSDNGENHGDPMDMDVDSQPRRRQNEQPVRVNTPLGRPIQHSLKPAVQHGLENNGNAQANLSPLDSRRTDSSSEMSSSRSQRYQQQGSSGARGSRNSDQVALPAFLRDIHKNDVVEVNGRPYLILGSIGKGGSSRVYKVLNENRATLALKRVHVRPNSNNFKSTFESYANEINLLRKLRHCSNIVYCHDAEVRESTGSIDLVMEYGDIDLAQRLNEHGKDRGTKVGKRIDDNFRSIYWQQMLEAVQTIHEQKIVHGDLKPANFLIVAGTLKLIDFGIAKAIQTEDTTKIWRDVQVGTPNYMSPEALTSYDEEDESSDMRDIDAMHRGSGGPKYRVGRASDIWSLGIILYQMVFGKTPFAHLTNIMKKLTCIQDDTYEIHYPDVDDTMVLDVLKGCLQRDPSKRMSIPHLLEHPFLRRSAQERGMSAVFNSQNDWARQQAKISAQCFFQLLEHEGSDVRMANGEHLQPFPGDVTYEKFLDRYSKALLLYGDGRTQEVGGNNQSQQNLTKMRNGTPTTSGVTTNQGRTRTTSQHYTYDRP